MNKKIISLILLLGAGQALFGADTAAKESRINTLRTEITTHLEGLHEDDSKRAAISLLEQDLTFTLEPCHIADFAATLPNRMLDATPTNMKHFKLNKRITRLEVLLQFLTAQGPELMPPS